MKRCCLQSELKALGRTLSEVGAQITPNKPYRAILMFQVFCFFTFYVFSGCYFIHQNNSSSTSGGEHGNAVSLWSFRKVLWTTKPYPTFHWHECRNFHVKLAPVKHNKYYKIVAMMFWLGPFCILTTGTWRCNGSSSKLCIIVFFNCHFVSFIAEKKKYCHHRERRKLWLWDNRSPWRLLTIQPNLLDHPKEEESDTSHANPVWFNATPG